MTSQCLCPNDLKTYLMVEYPGYVKNPDKALQSFGGLESLQRVFDSPKDRLELKFRPSDPLAHGAYGDRVPKKCFVLRIKKQKPTKQSTSQNTFEISVLGKVQTSFRFDTMAEFQWLPMQRDNMVEKFKPGQLEDGAVMKRSPESLDPTYVSTLDDILPIKNPFDNLLKNFNPDAPLLMLPAVFSRFDTPREIHQPHPKFRSEEMRAEYERQENSSIIGRTRKKRSTMSYLLKFSDAVPDQPQESLMEGKSSLSMLERNLVPKLEICFDRQKVWSKAALCYELNCTYVDIKYILPLVAFHYLTGPFRTMWVKYGYDPHQDPASKMLQTLDFRVKGTQDQSEYSQRSINQYQLPMKKNYEKSQNKAEINLKSMMSVAHSSHQSFDDTLDELIISGKGLPVTESMCKFRKDIVPAARQLSYQLKDIEIDEVQAIIAAAHETAECTEKDGWFPSGTIDRIRAIMTKTMHESKELVANILEAD